MKNESLNVNIVNSPSWLRINTYKEYSQRGNNDVPPLLEISLVNSATFQLFNNLCKILLGYYDFTRKFSSSNPNYWANNSKTWLGISNKNSKLGFLITQ